MNVLIDRHQADLFFAMQKLFEDRLGGTVYTPVGHDWWDQKYWQFGIVFGDDRLAKQYLDIEVLGGSMDHCGVVYDPCHPKRPLWTVTLEQARKLEWDFVVATVQENQVGLKRFADEVGAKFVVQCGNTGQRIDWSLDPLVISTSEMPIEGRGVTIHQEFDSGPYPAAFRFRDPAVALPYISTFVNLTPRIPQARAELDALKRLLPEFEFRVYGHEGPDGFITPIEKIAALMTRSMWGFHHKPQGDGFGHVIHGWAAVGRPLVGPSEVYVNRNMLAAPFWQDLVTCVDTTHRSIEEACALVREISADRERHAEMCRAIRATFDSLVDYDAEELMVRELLSL